MKQRKNRISLIKAFLGRLQQLAEARLVIATAAMLLGLSLCQSASAAVITNDIFATDTDGNPIYAQGGGVFKFPDPVTGVETYYWYGVKYSGAVTYQNDPWAGKNSDTGFLGFSCYSSTNLVDWKFENLSSAGLGGGWVGRMGVCYNENTGKYVLLSQNYPGVMFATCDTPNGTFVYHHTQSGGDLDFIVNDGTGDQTIFIDDDGTPYLICSSVSGRSHLYVFPLRASDYLEVLPATEIYSGSGREGNCMFKYNGKYYFCSSDLHGWNTSHCYVLESVGDNIMGPYLPEYVMERSGLDYCHVTQTGFFVTAEGTEGTTVLFVGDRWSAWAGNGIGFNQWSPLSFNGTKPTFESVSAFDLDEQAGTWSVAPDNNYILNPNYEADRITVNNVRGWTSTGSSYGNTSGSGHVPGRFHFHHYNGSSAYTATTHQRVTGLPNGTYNLSVWYKSSGGQTAARIFARIYGGAERIANINTSQPGWAQVTIPNISVTDRECEVGLYSDAAAGQYVDIDDWSLTLVEAAPPPPPGEKVNQWSFDETSGTTASDSISAQDGTLVGGASWSGGQFDNATLLDGSSGYVSLPGGVVSALNDFSIVGWFNLNSIQTWSRIFDFGTGTSANLFLTPRAVGTDGTIRFSIKANNTSSAEVINGVAAPTTGTWHHFAVTLNGSLGILYVDGVEVGRNTHMSFTPSDLGNTTQNWIGRSQYTSDPYLNGRVDDFRIYSYGLPATEVAALASGILPPEAPTNPGATPVSPTQINLNWTDQSSNEDGFRIERSTDGVSFEDVGNTTADTTTYQDGNLAPSMLYVYRVRAFNAGGRSDNTNTVEATTLTGPTLPPAGLSTTASRAFVALDWAEPPGAGSYLVKRASVSGGPYTTIAAEVPSGSYTDTEVGSGKTYYYVVSAVNNYGESPESGEADATTGTQVRLWPFDESSGTTATEGIAGQHGTLSSGASWTIGSIGNAALLNGTSGHVSFPNGVVSALDDFTISGWFYLNSLSTWSRIFDFGTGTTANMFLTPQPIGSGNPIRFAITDSGNTAEQQINGSIAPSTGTWHHFAVTLNGHVGILYMDGVEIGRNNGMTLSPSDLGNTTQNWLGRSQYGSDPYLNGRVDDFRIFNYGLTPEEVAALASGVTAPGTPAGVNATAVASSQINLNWDDESDADSYSIKRAPFAGGPYATVADGVTEPVYSDIGLTSGTMYFYTVSAVNVAGESPDSEAAGAMPDQPQSPAISTMDWVDGQLVLGGSNVTPGFIYHMLTTTNLALPLSNWTTIATDQFPADGSFSITNTVDPDQAQQYYMLQLP